MKASSASRPADVMIATAHAVGTIAVGRWLLGMIPSVLFFLGFGIGLVLWLKSPGPAAFRPICIPYLVTLSLFIAHKAEERTLGFFPALSKLTGVPIPESIGPSVVLLYALAAAWLLAPFLMNRQHPLGGYLAWSFFASMGVTELAHFAFPLFTGRSYAYFPGMASAVALVPAAWWGMWRMRSF